MLSKIKARKEKVSNQRKAIQEFVVKKFEQKRVVSPLKKIITPSSRLRNHEDMNEIAYINVNLNQKRCFSPQNTISMTKKINEEMVNNLKNLRYTK